jgi:hypothetical protein
VLIVLCERVSEQWCCLCLSDTLCTRLAAARVQCTLNRCSWVCLGGDSLAVLRPASQHGAGVAV